MSVKPYQARLANLRVGAANAVGRLWDELPNYDKPQASEFAARAVPLILTGQRLAAANTAAYLGRRLTIPIPRIDPMLVTGPAARRGIDPHDEYERPFGIVWHALGEGKPAEEAIGMGRARLLIMAATDIWLASRAASQVIGEKAGVTRWVRVADDTACDLCSAADGMPMDQAADLAGHPNCGCTAEPVTDKAEADSAPADPGAIDVHEHDELGPILYAAGDQFAEA